MREYSIRIEWTADDEASVTYECTLTCVSMAEAVRRAQVRADAISRGQHTTAEVVSVVSRPVETKGEH